MMKSSLLIAVLGVTSLSQGALIQLLSQVTPISVFDAVQERPPLFDGLSGMFDGLYGSNPNLVEVPSSVVAHTKNYEIASAYAINGGSGGGPSGPFYNLMDNKDVLPSFDSVMISGTTQPNVQPNIAQPGYQPAYNTPGLTGYGPDPTTNALGSPSYRSSGQ